MFNQYSFNLDADSLVHHGVKGQKWGVRRYQNYDGTHTPLGRQMDRARKKHAYKGVLFVSGSSKTQTADSGYYRQSLSKSVMDEIDKSIEAKEKIIVGDAPGIDRQVQDYLNTKGYKDVEVYGPGDSVRYTANEKWKTNPIDSSEYEEGSPEWLAKKDEMMTLAATKALAVTLDEGSKATKKNVARLLSQNKDVKVYELSKNGEEYDKWVNSVLTANSVNLQLLKNDSNTVNASQTHRKQRSEAIAS